MQRSRGETMGEPAGDLRPPRLAGRRLPVDLAGEPGVMGRGDSVSITPRACADAASTIG